MNNRPFIAANAPPPKDDDIFRVPRFRSSLRTALVFAFVLLSVVPVGIALSVTITRTSAQAQQQVFNQLESVAETKEQAILADLEDAQDSLRVALVEPASNASVVAMLTTSEPNEALQEVVAADLTAVLSAQKDFTEFFVYDLDGNIITSTNPVQAGKLVNREPYFGNSLEGEHIQPPFYAVGSAELNMLASRPLIDDSGQIVGVLAGRLSLDTLGQVMTQYAGLGDTGETYLVSVENNYLVTPSRSEGYVLTRSYHSEGIDNALAGQDGSGVYIDYRDPPQEVIGVYRWLPGLEVGLLAEMSTAEALAASRQAASVSATVAVLAALAAGIIGLIVALRITRPITELTRVTRELSEGHLGARARVEQRNEIGELAYAFNAMASQLQDTLVQLETSIKEALGASTKAREAEELLLLVMDNVPQAVFWKDRDLNYLGCNRVFAEDVGLASPGEIVGKSDLNLGTPMKEAETYRAEDRAVLESEQPRLSFEYLATIADSDERWLRASKVPMRNARGEAFAVLGVYEDITESKEAENLLKKQASDLRIATAMAREANRLKSEFLATMSHELRTPLNAIIGFAEIMLAGMAGKLDEKHEHKISRIHLNSRRLLSLINDLLDLAKIEAGRVEVLHEPFSPGSLAATLGAETESLAEQKDLDFEMIIDPGLPTELVGDAPRIEQAVGNLLSNAFKFTSTGKVALELSANGEETWNVSVIDTGIGIPPHALEYIFDEFRQVDTGSQRAYGGSGLGLSITRNLARVMGGDVRVSSSLGEGSKFTITLPMVVAGETEPEKVS
jgi:PAS domain S-box-containing protein